MKDVWSVAQVHHTTSLKIQKLTCLGNVSKIDSEQIALKALEKSSLLPSKVHHLSILCHSCLPAPPGLRALGRAPCPPSPPRSEPLAGTAPALHPGLGGTLARGKQPPARLQPEETTPHAAQATRCPKRNECAQRLRILSLVRASQLPAAKARAMPHGLVQKSVSRTRGHHRDTEQLRAHSCPHHSGTSNLYKDCSYGSLTPLIKFCLRLGNKEH